MIDEVLSLGELLEAVHSDPTWHASEALFLTFNADAGFFEQSILGRVRALGARVTVIADASVWDPDPLTLQRAGVEYAVGLAGFARAFHPKVMLLVGDDRVLAALGSGNLTLGGWQYNSELFSILRTDGGTAPAALSDLAGWLRQLAEVITLPEVSAQALTRVADHVDRVLAQIDVDVGGARLVHSLQSPILEQLPEGRPKRLMLTAPFIDSRAEAVGALLRRFAPDMLTLVVQEGSTVASADALSELVEAGAGVVEVVIDRSSRYRHAKLIEAAGPAGHWRLSGSANLTAAALLRGVRAGGNVELGLLTFGPSEVWPDPGFTADGDVATTDPTIVRTLDLASMPNGSLGRRGPLIAGVTLRSGEVTLDLVLPVLADLEVQCTSDPIHEEWSAIGLISPRRMQFIGAFAPRAPGQLFRVVEMDGEARISPVVPGNVYERILARPLRRGAAGKVPRTSDDLLGVDDDYLLGLYAQMQHVREEASSSSTTPGGGRGREVVGPQESTPESTEVGWLWEADRIAREVHGPGITAFALGLPAVSSAGRWESFDGEEIGELEGDPTATTDDDRSDGKGSATAGPRAPDWLRAARRKRINDYVVYEDMSSVVSALLAARVSLYFYLAATWDEDDAAPIDAIRVFLERARQFPSDGDDDRSVRALSAVALACIRPQMRDGPDEMLVAWDRLLRSLSNVDIRDVPDDVLEEYCRNLRLQSGRVVDPRWVREDAASLRAWGRQQGAMLAAEERGLDVHRIGPDALLVQGDVSKPDVAAFDLVIRLSVVRGEGEVRVVAA